MSVGEGGPTSNYGPVEDPSSSNGATEPEAPQAEPEAPQAEPEAPPPAQTTITRRDVYARPMRAGRPIPNGVISRGWKAVRYRFSSELQRREWAVDERLAHVEPLTRPHTISVISPKGGVGKTTISFMLGNLLASRLRVRAVVLDANPDFGTLAALAPDDQRSTRSLADLLADSEGIESPAALHPYVSQLSTGVHLLGGPADAEVMAEMTPGLYNRLLDLLERFYEVLILDLGTGITGPIAQFAVERANQSIVITTPEWITAAGVLDALRYLQLDQATLVLNQVRSGRDAAAWQAIEENFRRQGVHTRAAIPYDERLRLMLDTGTYSLEELGRPTRVPIKELGAAVVGAFL